MNSLKLGLGNKRHKSKAAEADNTLVDASTGTGRIGMDIVSRI